MESAEGFRVSVSELARIKGVTKQTVSERLARLQEQGLIEVRRRGKEKTVSLAEWDTAVGETTDPARLAAQATRKAIAGTLEDEQAKTIGGGKPPADPSYTKELTRKAGYEADLKKIEIDKQRRELLPIAEVTDAMTRCAEAIVRDIDQLPAFADDLAGAMNRAGVPGLREALKAKARELRTTLARSMTLIADEQDEDEGREAA